ncbi:MAG: TIGR02921 family PEP-CTERM protein [Chloroflexota bacterium]
MSTEQTNQRPLSLFSRLRSFGAHALFWSWNIIFLTVLLLGFLPIILIELFWAIRDGSVPLQFFLYGTILVAIPAIAILIAAMTSLRKDYKRLLAFGYGVEGPLMLILGIRFFVVRQVTPAVGVLMIVGVLGMFTLMWQLLDRKINERSAWFGYLRIVGLTLLLAIGVYISVWLFFYVPPLIAQIFSSIGYFIGEIPYMLDDFRRTMRSESFFMVPFFLIYFFLGSILAGYTATLFIALPIVVPILYVRAWGRGLEATGKRISMPAAYALSFVALVSVASLFIISNRQPQRQAFELLETPPTNLAEAKELIGQQEEIRAGLLNAYLAPFRYASSEGEVYHIREAYQWTFNMDWEETEGIQRFYEWVAQPLLYEPAEASVEEMRDVPDYRRWQTVPQRPIAVEPARAAELYEPFFDIPINEGEREAVVRAARTTWEANRAEAAWQAVAHREIHLVQQELNVSEQGDWAEFELHEAYRNRTFDREEVVYYFSLPESAVITGVWLGNSENREERFVYQVAPRGAAQQTYKNEVRRNVDPALVEQIGTRQYRLRIFPIEPPQTTWDSDSRRSRREAPTLHMWMTWRAFAQDGEWPMPQLSERLNVYWDGRSERLINDEPMSELLSTGDTDDNASWLPKTLTMDADAAAQTHRVDFPGGRSVIIEPVEADELPSINSENSLAVVLDRSRSMANVASLVDEAFDRFARLAADGGVKIDVYLTASEYRGEEPSVVPLEEVESENILYFGGQNAAELLAQYDELRQIDYDAVFVISDGTGYSLNDKNSDGNGDEEREGLGTEVPIWMVHLDGLPLGYDDPTLEVIQASGGGVTDSLNDALTRFAVSTQGLVDFADLEISQAMPDAIDGYGWAMMSTGEAAQRYQNAKVHAPSDDFAAFAGRRIILAEMMRNRGDLASLDILDELHAMAIEHSIVTPYSSMIVLINERQQRMLDELSAQADRFDREFEDVGETPTVGPQLTGVPEPEEWLLIIIAVAMLGWYAYQSREKLLGRFV